MSTASTWTGEPRCTSLPAKATSRSSSSCSPGRPTSMLVIAGGARYGTSSIFICLIFNFNIVIPILLCIAPVDLFD